MRVDGKGGDVAEVLALPVVLLRYGRVDLLRRILHVLRIFVWQVVLCEDGIHLRIVVASLAEHVNHLADHVLVVLRRPLCNLYHSLVVALSSLQLALGYDNVVDEDIAVGDKESEVLLHAESAHEGVLSPLDDACHHSLSDMVLAAGHESKLHLVAGEGEHGVSLSHEDWCCSIVGNDGILAVRLALEGAFLHLSVHVQLVCAVSFPYQEVVPCHLFHHVDGKHLCRMRVESECSEYLFKTMLLIWILNKEVLQFLCNLFFVQSSSSFSAFCHNRNILC